MRTNRPLLAAMVTAALALIGGQAANAQDLPTKHLVFTEKAAFVTGVRSVLAGANSEIHPDPRGRYALITESVAPPRENAFTLENAPANLSPSTLSLYDSHTGKTKILWRGDTDGKSTAFGSVVWLAGTDTVLCSVIDSETALLAASVTDQNASSLLLVHPTSTGIVSRVIYQGKGFLSIHASPTLPIAAIDDSQFLADKDGHYTHNRHFTADARGRIGADIEIGPKSTGGFTWNADGTITYFRDRISASVTAEPGNAPAPERSQSYAFNVQTHALTPIDSEPPYVRPAKPADTNPLYLVSGTFAPVPPAGSGQTLPMAKATKFAPLWLVRRDSKAEGHLPTAAVIAPDAQSSVLLADDSAVLYVADNAVYAVPITRELRPDIDAAYRKLLQQQALSNARQIGLALIGFTQDNDETFPQAGELAGAMATYAKNDSLLNNPETDTPGFTFALAGQKYSDIADPAGTVLGYLAGPGGRVALMADGHTHWEDTP